MHRHLRRARRIAVLTVPAILVGAGISPARAAGPGYTTIVDGLRNPRGIAFSADGKLYVAEGGEGGDVCGLGVDPESGEPLCGGLSGRISRVNIRDGARDDYLTGLASVGGPLFAIGPSGIGVQGNQVIAIMGANDQAAPPPEVCEGNAACTDFLATALAQFGHVVRGVPSGNVAWKQDVGKVNYTWTVDNKAKVGAGNPAYQPGYADNPDFEPGDSNPYALAVAPGGAYTVDGGSNTLTWVPQQGEPKVLVAFPNPPDDGNPETPYDAVPTCVAPSGGKVVVADLNGRIYVVDGSSITTAPITVSSDDGAFLVASGGCAADGKGNVYISDILLGSVVKLSVATSKLSWVAPPDTLNFPAGVAIGKDGKIYVANNGVCAGFPIPAGSGSPCDEVTGSIVRLG